MVQTTSSDGDDAGDDGAIDEQEHDEEAMQLVAVARPPVAVGGAGGDDRHPHVSKPLGHEVEGRAVTFDHQRAKKHMENSLRLFASRDPTALGAIICWRLTCSPVYKAMHSYMHTDSIKFEAEQQATAAIAPTVVGQLNRSYPVLEAARSNIEGACLLRIRQLMLDSRL